MSILHGDVRFYNNVFVQPKTRQGLIDICAGCQDGEWDDENLKAGTFSFNGYMTEDDFNETLDFCRKIGFSKIHVFPYSERPGTKALNIPYVVDEKEKKHRSKLMLDLSERKTLDFYESHIAAEALVLLEHARKGMPMHGFTENYIRVEMPSQPDLDNKIVKVRLGEFNEAKNALIAKLIK